MVQVYYRTREAFLKNPVVISAPLDGIEASDYTIVHEWPTADAPDLEEVFDLMNRDSGSDLVTKKGIRSMMPGDCVRDEAGDVWFCCSLGWEETFGL